MLIEGVITDVVLVITRICCRRKFFHSLPLPIRWIRVKNWLIPRGVDLALL
jgi:hypothetical protein